MRLTMRNRKNVIGLADAVIEARPAETTGAPAPRLDRSRDDFRHPPDPSPAAAQSEKWGFVPRDRALALLQARYDENPAVSPNSLVRGLQRLLSLLPEWLYDPYAEGLDLSKGIDPGWAESYYELIFVHASDRIAFALPPGPPAIRPLAEKARVILVGDWGTGAEFAQRVATQIGKWVTDERETHLVHLGDVYYAGTTWEAENKFLAFWPRGAAASWCLNGNHDMYAAGVGLKNTILKDRRFAGQRTVDGDVATEFHLRNDHWQILGIDTSWEYTENDPDGQDGHLGEQQRRWLDQVVPHTASPRTIVLSHHPGFVNDGGHPSGGLLADTAPLRTGGRRIAAWFWGHKHRLITYDTPGTLGIDYAACMGHGAIPERPDENDDGAPTNETRFVDTLPADKENDVWYKCGFAVLDLDGPEAIVRYIDLNGDPWGDPTAL